MLNKTKLENAITSKAIEMLTRKLLKNLAYKKGNTSAMDLLNGHNGIISLDDCISALTVSLCEYIDSWKLEECDSKKYFASHRIVFTNNDDAKVVLGSVSKELYKFATKDENLTNKTVIDKKTGTVTYKTIGHKKLYIDVYNDTTDSIDSVSIDKIDSMKYITNTMLEDIENMPLINQFIESLPDHYRTVLEYRINTDYTQNDIANAMKINVRTVKRYQKAIREMWDAYNPQFTNLQYTRKNAIPDFTHSGTIGGTLAHNGKIDTITQVPIYSVFHYTVNEYIEYRKKAVYDFGMLKLANWAKRHSTDTVHLSIKG